MVICVAFLYSKIEDYVRKGECIMVKFGIIGAGGIAKSHAVGICSTLGAELVAVCDKESQRAQALAESYGAGKIYIDYHELLQDPEIDAVCVCLPSGMHGQVVMDAALAGKHILLEKPIEVTKEKIDMMIEAVENSGVKVGCVFQRRVRGVSRCVKQALNSGMFGRVLMANAYMKYYRTPEYYENTGWRATWEMDGGGALMNQGIHGIDLICWLMGGITQVRAMTRTQLHNIPVEDAAVAVVEYANGAIGTIEGATCVNPGQKTRFEIHCENGSIVFGDDGILKWTLNGEDLEAAIIDTADPETKTSNDHSVLVADLVKSIETGKQPEITLRDARRSVDAILAIYQSSREGRSVLL